MAVSIEAAIDFRFISSASCTLTETGGGAATGSIQFTSSDGPYFLSDDNSAGSAPTFPAFVDALKTKLDTVGNATYTVGWDKVDQKITITAAGGSVTAFALTSMNTSFKNLTGFTADKTGALTYESDVAPYFQIQTTLGVLSNYGGVVEDGKDGTVDHIAHDGTAYGIAKPGVPVMWQADVPHEPRSIVDDEATDPDFPWTWLHFFRYTRNTLPYSLRWNQGDRDNYYYLQNYASDSFLSAKNSKGDALDSHKTVKLKARRIGFKTAASAGAFVPTDIGAASLSLWLTPASVVGGATPTGWDDISGNSRTFTVSGVAIGTATEGSTEVISINSGPSDTTFLSSSATLANIISNNASHVFIVCRPTVDFTDTTGYLQAVLGESGGYWAVGGYIPGAVNKLAFYNWDGTQDIAATNFTSNQLVCIEAAHSGGNIYCRAHLTGSSSSIASAASGNTSLLTGTLRIGRNYSSSYYRGWIHEIITVNRVLTPAEQANFRSYLNTIWGINNPGSDLY